MVHVTGCCILPVYFVKMASHVLLSYLRVSFPFNHADLFLAYTKPRKNKLKPELSVQCHMQFMQVEH